ncbi:MAG: hypothetical protein OXG38_04535 [Chloroflexi bacterium]|nr:hypothetical protein [Chloroflexota bacterium]
MASSNRSRLPVPIEGVLREREREHDVPALLPALRSDLAPLVPTMRRAATVIVAAAVADWAVRAGTRAALDAGARAVLGQRSNGTRQNGAAHRSETVVHERVIVHRTS